MLTLRSLVLGLCLVAFAAGSAAAAERPNFVVFIFDDHGWNDCTVNGATDVRTPNMQRLAAGGMTFTHAFVASPSCAPSRAALLTGLMPARNGAEPNHSKPRPEIKKLPAYLQELGYEVAAFGKVSHYNHGPDYGFDRVGGEGFHNHTGIGQALELLKTRSKDKPLCLFVGTNWPHVPWPETDAYQPEEVQLPPTHVDTAETRHWRARYYDAVSKADEHLGTILDAAREHLDPQNTYFFCTSDHGAQWPFGKWNLYDAGVRVPLLVAGPGIETGSKTGAMASWIDLLPTLVDLAGGQPPADIDGRSFARVLRGQADEHRDAIYTTHSGDGGFNVYPMRSLRTKDWKYILNLHPEYQFATHINRAAAGDGLRYWQSWEAAAKDEARAAAIVARYKRRPREELYDLAADPHEQNNLADDPRHAERLNSMRETLAAWMKAQGDASRVYGEPLMLGEEATPIRPAGKGKKTGKKK